MAEHNYISLDEFRDLLFYQFGLKEQSAKRAAARYLKALQQRQIIHSFPVHFSHKRKLYCLTGFGYGILFDADRLRCNPRNKFSPSKFQPNLLGHEIAVVQTRIIMESHPYIKDFKPEKVLYYNYWQSHGKPPKGKSCDAQMKAEAPGRSYNIGVEVQISRKAKDMYSKYIRTQEQAGGLDVVLWICRDKTIMGGIQQAARRQTVELKYLFTTLPELRAKGLAESTWQNIEGTPGHIFRE